MYFFSSIWSWIRWERSAQIDNYSSIHSLYIYVSVGLGPHPPGPQPWSQTQECSPSTFTPQAPPQVWTMAPPALSLSFLLFFFFPGFWLVTLVSDQIGVEPYLKPCDHVGRLWFNGSVKPWRIWMCPHAAEDHSVWYYIEKWRYLNPNSRSIAHAA